MNLRVRKSFAAATPAVHGGKAREAAARLGEIYDFSANINPLGSPPLEEIVLEELKSIGHYPDNTYREFRLAAAAFAGVNPENIVPANGSSEIIRLFAEMALEEGDFALVPTPSFGEYENQARLAGAKIASADLGLPQAKPLDQSFPDHLLERCHAAFFCNPNNPTGHLTTAVEVEGLARRCEQSGTFLLVDEAFIELSDPQQSVTHLAPQMENLIVMRSLTKSFGVPGLRLGFGVASEKTARILDAARIPWSIGSIAAAAAPYLLSKLDFLKESRQAVELELGWLRGELQALGLDPLPSRVNFILVDVRRTGLPSTLICQRAARQRVLLRDCQSFGLGQDFIRVAVRSRPENRRLIQALKKAVGG